MRKIMLFLSALAVATPIHAATRARPKAHIAVPAAPIPTPDTKPAIVDPTAPEMPKGTWQDSDKFETRQDAHGHDYDVRTGEVICLDKPFPYKDSLYGSPTMRNIPLGHVRCISRDRNFTTI